MHNLIVVFKRVWLDAALLTVMTVAALETCAATVRFHRNPDSVNAMLHAMVWLLVLCGLQIVFNWHVHRQLKRKDW